MEGAVKAGDFRQRAMSWLQGRRGSGGPPGKAGLEPKAPIAKPPSTTQALVCMRVEPQDVMMLETVKERHLRKESDSHAADAEVQSSPSAVEPVVGCRLVPRLVDLRRAAEARRDGVHGSIGVDVTRSACVTEFLDWAHHRSKQVSAHGLQPMHVLMTADGGLSGDQQGFLKGMLEYGLPNVCILVNGYESLRPFFLESEELGAAEDPGAKVARDLLKKGIGNLHSLWQKAPSRQLLWETVKEVAPERGGRLAILPGSWTADEGRRSATFNRAPLPPGETDDDAPLRLVERQGEGGDYRRDWS